MNFVFGPDGGNNVIEATFADNPGLPATFTLYGVARDPAKPTSLTGLVLDNSSQPIGHAWCEIFIAPDFTNPVITTFTDTQGRFAFPDLGGAGSTSPISISGPIDLFIYGPSATSVGTNAVPPNSFPFLSYSMVLIPNAENSLPKPVLLPRLNVNNQRLYYGTNDLVLTCEGMEGLKMTIKANSMKDARGIPVTPANPAVVSLNQVHHDQVPMPIPDGASPPFAWTLQPARSTFDPPIEIEYPNMSGLAAGTIAYFLSFNHDTGRFEIVASGHVTGDGSTIMSDAGAGLTIAGWGCNCPPYAVAGNCQKKCTKCPDELTIQPITDPEALSFENGNTLVWTASDTTIQANLTDLRSRLSVFECLAKQADASAVVAPNSAYRPQTYQDHFYNIKQASVALKNLDATCKTICASQIAQINVECSKHGICQNPVAKSASSHGAGKAVDVGKTLGSLAEAQIRAIAQTAGLSLLVESTAYHLTLSGSAGSCQDPSPAGSCRRCRPR